MQRDAKHTPGPWRAMAGVEDESRWGVVTAQGGFLVAVIENGAPGDTLRTEEANAAVMAAAPDMLAALRHCTEEFHHMHPQTVAEVQAAIAKAEAR